MALPDQYAISARYDQNAEQIVLVMNTGIEVRFRPADVEGMQGATAEQLAQIEISIFGVHWEALDVDLSIDGILRGRLGRRAWDEQRLANAPPRPPRFGP